MGCSRGGERRRDEQWNCIARPRQGGLASFAQLRLPPTALPVILGSREGIAVSRVRTAAIIIAILLAMYVGIYFALLDTSDRPQSWIGPKYRIEGETTRAVFAPLAWVDLQVRPGYWNSHFHLSNF